MQRLDEIYRRSFFSGRRGRDAEAVILARVIMQTFPAIKSVIDAGCATGHLITALRAEGVDAWGIEGSEAARDYTRPEILPFVRYHDLRTQDTVPCTCDAVTCFEVIEHVEPEYQNMLLQNLCFKSDLLILTIAGPGQEGTHHVNLQPVIYWEKAFYIGFGFYKSVDETEIFKRNLLPYSYQSRDIMAKMNNAMIFRKA